METIETTRQFSLEDNLYGLQSGPGARFLYPLATELGNARQELVPITIVTWSKPLFTQDDLHSISRTFGTEDDVWCPGFLSVVVLLQPRDLSCIVKTITQVVTINATDLRIPDGPYVFRKAAKRIQAVCRLYDDTNHAFVSGILPRRRREEPFRSLNLSVNRPLDGQAPSTPGHLKIPVPSRLYSTPSRKKPLAGLRIAIKDTIRLQGLKTGFGNDAWQKLYPAEKSTAPAIKLLIAVGAVIVGKAKTSEFGEGVDAHQWNGSTCPVNPRGDGEQKPSSSSTGSAVAAAAYSWLDCTVGTDTGGSIRHPAGVNGLFGNRTTQSAVNLRGVYSATDLLNTLGIFARDATTFSKIGKELLPTSFLPLIPRSARKYKLLYPVRSLHQGGSTPFRWFPNPLNDSARLSAAEKQMETFVQELEHHLGCDRSPFNLDELWRAMKPRGQPDSLDEATGSIYSALVSYFAVHVGGINRFVADYAAAHDGQEPTISRVVRLRQDYGRSLRVPAIAKHLESKQVFANWVENVLFGPVDEEAITLLIYPQSFGVPNYRDEIPEDFVCYDKFSVFSFGYLVGCPDYTVPIGEVPFLSKITNETSYLPVSLSMVARRGNDVPLFDILTLLEEKGVLRPVKTGSRMY